MSDLGDDLYLPELREAGRRRAVRRRARRAVRDAVEDRRQRPAALRRGAAGAGDGAAARMVPAAAPGLHAGLRGMGRDRSRPSARWSTTRSGRSRCSCTATTTRATCWSATRARPGILDFQDAVRGPITYDLVSLLRDCYIAWPEDARVRLGRGLSPAPGRGRADPRRRRNLPPRLRPDGPAAPHQGARHLLPPLVSRRQGRLPRRPAAGLAVHARGRPALSGNRAADRADRARARRARHPRARSHDARADLRRRQGRAHAPAHRRARPSRCCRSAASR